MLKNLKKLTREEMKKVSGGTEPVTCGGNCKSDSECPSKCQCLGEKKGCQPIM
jgi:hypothetical protein